MDLNKAKVSLFEEGLEWITQVQVDRTNFFGENHEVTLNAQIMKALLLREFCKYEESLNLLKVILKKQEIYSDLGMNDPSAITTKFNMATILQAQGKYEEALDLYEQVLAQREKILGYYNFSTHSTRNCIAIVQTELAHFSKALALIENTEKMVQDEYQYESEYEYGNLKPDQDPQFSKLLFVLKHNRAGVFYKMGKVQKASVLLNEVWEEQKQILGENHKDTISSLYSIACILEVRGKFQKALKLYRKVYESRKESLGLEHPKTRDAQRIITAVERKIEEKKHRHRPCVCL